MDDTKPNTALHWFRKNLRLHDNPALCEAIKGSGCLFTVYILPPVIPDTNISANRWNFLIECLEDLDHSLRSIGSQLLVVRGYPAEIIPKLIKCLHVTKLTFESESEPFSRQRDAVITHLAESVGVKVVSCTSHTLYDVDSVIKANNNETPMLFDDFLDVVSTLGPPETPVGTVSHDMLASLLPKRNMFEDCRIPSVEDLGIERSKGSCQETWPGGESEALRKLDIFLQEMVDVDFQVDSASEAFLHGFTDRLSPYLRFGCLSPRTYYHALSETYQSARNQRPPLSLFSWLLRRDFHFVLGSNNPTLNRRENNPLCLQINWEENAVAVQKWKMGKTGFPFIDAIMRQLQQEGWIPCLARQIVGSFLTQGCMWISWEEGFKVFGELQLDAEWSLNAGSWLWISGSAFDQNRLPIFCPVETAKKIDPKGEYTRKYVPEVKDLPMDYVFEPWKAPECVQQAAGCLLGTHYPLPVVDHEEQRRVCVQRLKEIAESVGESIGVDERGHTSVHLFRKDLRLHDNPTLRACLEDSGTFYPVYVLDTKAARESKISPNRWNFLLECLRDLDNQLARVGSRLFVVRGRDVEILPKLFAEWGVTRLSFESDIEPFGAQRDSVIRHIAEEAGVEVLSKTSHTLYEPGDILRANRGIAPMMFEDFVGVLKENGLTVPSPVKEVDRQLFGCCVTPVAADHQANFGVPELSDLGVKDTRSVTSAYLWKGGEQEALRRLELLQKQLVKNDFEDEPLSGALMSSSATHLSPYLRFGCLSSRVMWQRINDTYWKAKGKMPPLSLHEPLLFREFFFLMGCTNPSLHKMADNPMSCQYPWEENPEGLRRWKEGKTGFPWIDAVMRQLHEEGWIPHFARQAVGCFLTRGSLWINWEEGYKVFDELQLDAEWSLNVGNWLWLSGGTFVNGHVPWFCPVEVGKKIDPTGEYVRKYVPEVKDMPVEYVFEPWKAPESVQKAAGCLVGKDYPLPVVDHEEQRRVCVQRLKELAESVGESIEVDERGHTSVHLFRKDLRLHDNPTLRACLEGSGTFYPVYVLDTKAARESKISSNRWNFLLECLRDLDNQLARVGSRLFVVRGRDVEILPKLFAEWGVTRLSFETDIEPFGAQRDSVIRHIAEEAGVEVLSKTSHTLYEPGDILRANRGIAPMVFEDFVGVLKENGLTVPSPVKEVDRQLFGCCVTPIAADHQTNFGVPELSDLGVKDIRSVTSAYLWKGGEQEALRRLELLQKQLVKNDFEDEPLSGALMSSSATHLSPYLRFGCLSSRVMWQRINDTYWKAKGKMPSLSLHKPLLFREFFFLMGCTNPSLHKMADNPVSCQYPWEENPEGLRRWKEGKTGFPWIDAVMRQLHEEGWIPHFARQAVGCFLTRGSLWINWEEGYKVFDELQLDAEWSLNVGNWLWLSGGTFVNGHVPWFCPVEVGKKIDPTGEYVRKYVPEVKDMPVEYVFEPWKAPESVQKAAGCLVGKDYPLPVVDHEEQRRVCVQRLKELAESVGESIEVDERGHTSVHLFRKDLRLHDNPTLRACLEGSGTFYPVYVLDTKAARESKISSNRWNFLLECLRDLDNQLARVGSRLFVVRGRDVEILPKLFAEWGVTRLSFETDIEPFDAQRDSVIRHIAEEAGVEVLSKTSHTLYEPGDILRANRGIAPMVFEDFVGVLKENGLTVPSPVKEVDRQLFGCCVTPVAADHQANFGVPELSDLGVKDVRLVTSGCLWKGGEQEALRRLVLLEEKLLKNDFENEPLSGASMPSSATHLSPYLRFGCLSPRLMWQRTVDSHWKAKGTMPPISLLEPLLLREFFFVIANTNSGLDKMESNPFSIQYPWEENPEWLQRWKQGTTGFPWIDAVMRQLRQEGWIPHLARQAVGCFLTRGCLWINWEEGYKVFDELLLDAEWSLNVGNWLWLSGSAFMKGHVPWFCPVEVGKKIDPTGEYVKKYVPEVKRLPLKYLFEPWKAPFKVQQAARCIVGDDYPEPVADHIQQRIICVQRLKDLCISLDILGHRSLHWFRKDLRLHDNPSLRECLRNSRVFYGVFFLPNIEGKQGAVSPNRWEFLLQSLQDLDNNLAECGSRLFVISGNPTEILPQLFKKWNITRLSFEVDSEPFCNMRDAVICDLAKKDGVEVISRVSHTLYDPRAVSGLNTGNVPLLFDDFKAIVLEQMKAEMPVPRVDRKLFGACVTPVGKDHHQLYGVPKLNDICSFSKSSSICSELYPGGEQEGLKRMETALQEMKKNDFCEPEVTAYSLLPSSRHLSPYLRFGCLSSRLLHQRITEEYIKTKGSNPPPEFYDKLLWREYFFAVGSRVPGAHEMVNNPLSLQIPWEDSDEYLERWKQGMTGFPWIDAIMRQLRSEGWIHDLARRAVGSFLTRGCLWINWEEGFKVFDEFQLDAERSLNSGNWLWLSTSTFVKGHVPWFCPVGVGKKIDPTGEYVRKYVPELRNVPTEFVFEPWLAPLDLQRYCGCVIGRDYPAPIVNHLEQRVICVQRMREMALKLTSH